MESGKLRTLAVMADKRLAGLPDVPTLKERYVGMTSNVWRGIAVAKSTPPEIVNKLREVARKVAGEPSFRDTLQKQNLTFSHADARLSSRLRWPSRATHTRNFSRRSS